MHSMERELILAGACVLTALAFVSAAPAFGTVGNLEVIFRNSTELILVGLGMSLLLASASIDVSVGVALGLIAIAVGQLFQAGVPAPLAALAGPVAGALAGPQVASAAAV